MTFEVRKGDTAVRSVWTNCIRNAFRKQAGWAKQQKVRATAATHWTARVWYRHNQRWLQASKEGAQRKIAAYQQQYADNQNISFLPAIVSTSTRMNGEFLRLLFLQAYRETEAHFTAAGMSSHTNNSEALRFNRTAFYNGLKSKVGLADAKAAALRVNLNVQGGGIVATPMHAPSRTPLLLPLFHTISLPPAFTSA